MILVKKYIVILGVIGLLLSACDSGGGDSTNNSDNSNNSDNGGFIVEGDGNTVVVEAADATDIEPPNRNLIEELQSRVDGYLLLIPYINSVRPRNEQGEGFQWNIPNIKSIETIDFSDIDTYLTAPSNDVSFELVFLQRQGYADVIASTRVDGVSSNNGGTITSESLFWSYIDLDQDGLFDVEELGVRPADCDGDNLVAYQDSDSDNDGIIDSQDSTPHGPPCV